MANEQVIPTVGKAELNSEIKVEINTTPTGESATCLLYTSPSPRD